MRRGHDHGGTGHGRRRAAPALAALATVLVAALASSAGAANPSGGLLVRVLPHAGDGGVSDLYLSPGELDRAKDVSNVKYTKRYAAGSSSIEEISGTSAAEVAELAGVPRTNVDGLEIRAPGDTGNGTPLASLSRSEAIDGFSGDPLTARDSLPRMLVFRNINAAQGGEQLVFRPLRGDGDVNPVEIVPSGGQTLRVSIATVAGTVAVSVAADRTQVDPRAPVALTAQIAGGRSVAGVRWVYGDGAGSSGSDLRPTHAFAEAGSYRIRAIVTTTDGASGVGIVDVRVGTPPPVDSGTGAPDPGADGPGGTPGGGTGGEGAPASGPDAGAGSAVGGTPGPSVRRPRKAGGTTSSSGKRAGDHRRSTARRPRAGTPTTPRAAATPPAPEPTPDPAVGSGTGGSGGDGGDAAGAAGRTASGATTAPPVPSAAGGGQRTPPAPAPRSANGAGEPVVGVLVGARTVAATPIDSAADRAPAARRGGEPRPSPSRPLWLLGVLAVVALLGLGAARELRPFVLRFSTPDAPAR